MIMRRLLLLWVFIFSTFLAWPVDFHRIIVWHQPALGAKMEIQSFGGLFDGAVLVEGSKLPYWVESFELQLSNAEVAIKKTVFEPLTDHSIVLPDSIGPELKFSSVTGTSAGKSYLRVSVFPFVKRNGQILKLTEFNLSVNENSNVLKSVTASFLWKSTSV